MSFRAFKPSARQRTLIVSGLVLVLLLFLGTTVKGGTGQPLIVAIFQTVTPSPTLTATPVPPTGTPGPSPTFTDTPEPTITPSITPSPTETPSPTPQAIGQPTLGFYLSTPPVSPPTEIPTPVGRITVPENVVNILLIGTDTISGNSFRTDTMIVVSINKDTGSVTLISIPRDLYVFIPQWTMQRINAAYARGNNAGYPGGGASLLIQTILYNFGLPIHYHVRVDFDGFKKVVDTLGGIDVPVWCQLDDYLLKVPPGYYEMTPEEKGQYTRIPENWEPYTVPVGIQHMDGQDALFFARLRQSYRTYVSLPEPKRAISDYDRARRQQQVLRAVYRKALSLDIIPQTPALFSEFSAIVDTDMGLGDILQFVSLVGKMDQAHIRSRFIGPGQVTSWTNPVDNANLLLPKPDEIRALLEEAMRPPSQKQTSRTAAKVEIWNGTTNADWDALAVDRLGWEGFAASVGTPDRTDYPHTTIIDFTSSAKGSSLEALAALLGVKQQYIVAQPDPNSPVQYRVILGANYDTCGTPILHLATQTPTATIPPISNPEIITLTSEATITPSP